MKKILLFISTLIMFLSFNCKVNADTYDLIDYSIMGRGSLPFNTYFFNNEKDAYIGTDNFFIFSTSKPKYIYFTACATGDINLTLTSVSSGVLAQLETLEGNRCTTQGYNGIYFTYRFFVSNWDDAGNGNYGIQFNMEYFNDSGYTVYLTGEELEYYTELPGNDNDNIIVDQNDVIINQNQTIIDQNNATNDKLDETNDKLEDLNNNLTNDNVSGATSSAGNFFSGFETDTFGLTSIITAPLTLIQSITNSSCSSLGLPLPYVNKSIHLPCLSSIYQQYFGPFLTLYQTITFGIVAYWVCVRIFALVKDFKNPDHDEVEVLDL